MLGTPVLAAATAVAVLALAPSAHAAESTGSVHNPGFEAGAGQAPAGWPAPSGCGWR